MFNGQHIIEMQFDFQMYRYHLSWKSMKDYSVRAFASLYERSHRLF